MRRGIKRPREGKEGSHSRLRRRLLMPLVLAGEEAICCDQLRRRSGELCGFQAAAIPTTTLVKSMKRAGNYSVTAASGSHHMDGCAQARVKRSECCVLGCVCVESTARA